MENMENDGAIYSEEIEKVVNEENRSCALYGTDACRVLNAENCSECAVGRLAKDKQEQTKAALERLIDAAHPDELQTLYAGDTCRFCRSETKGEAKCWALFDLTKRDPGADWTIALGKKNIGMKGADMILPLQVSCCKKCRSKYRLWDILPSVIGVAIAAAGLIVSTSSAVYKPAHTAAAWLPAAMMAGSVVVAVIAAMISRAIFRSALKKQMLADVAEIPEIKKLIDVGFAELTPKRHGVSALVFSKERRAHGVCSRIDEPRPFVTDPMLAGEPMICGIWPAEPVPEGMPAEPGSDEETAGADTDTEAE